MRPELDLVLTWGDSVVAWKRVPFDARLVPHDHFALPDELSPHSLSVRASPAEAGERPPRFRFDRAFGLAVIAALLTHVAVAWLGVITPDDEGEALTGARLAAVRAASVDRGDEATTEGAPRAGGAAAPIAYGVAVAARGMPEPDHDTDEARDVGSFGMVGLLDVVSSESSLGFGVQPRSDSTLSGGGAWLQELGGSGLDLSGTGEGGGGPGSAVSLSEVGGLDIAKGVGHDVRLTGHVASIVCHLHYVDPVVLARLDATAIQRVVRQNDGRFRGCYQGGLLRNPALEGRVTVKFAIARDGSVVTAEDDAEASDLPDAEVRSCVVRAFSALTFSEPGGVIRVTYPIVFSPAD